MDVQDMETYITGKLSQLPIHQNLKRSGVSDLLWALDASSLNPSATWDEKSSVYPRIGTRCGSTEDMNNQLVDQFNDQSFIQRSAFLKILF